MRPRSRGRQESLIATVMEGRSNLSIRLLVYCRHPFPPIWLYPLSALSYLDVEERLAERGLDLSYETVRRGVSKLGPGRYLPTNKRISAVGSAELAIYPTLSAPTR
jgi:hypothetical protein